MSLTLLKSDRSFLRSAECASHFTTSVQTALGEMRFRPAKRRGKPVRQLVEQRFRFQLGRSAQIATHAG